MLISSLRLLLPNEVRLMCVTLCYMLPDMRGGRIVRYNSLGWHCHVIHCVGKHMQNFVV